jgi:photosystem II stability/assembly factor-like uncharacterized protein
MHTQRSTRLWSLLVLLIIATFFSTSFISAQEVSPNLYSGLRWRLIGPHRAGRVTCVAGVPEQPNVYYFGTPGGGVWKTTDGGQVWEPIFDDQRVASIGAMAVSPSNPNIVYVGTGEQTQGNGVYKSTDAGATWTNVGLKDTHIITGLVVDPRDPDVVLVAASGDFMSGDHRGVFKTTDGGKTWQKTLFKDNETRVMDLNMGPDTPKVFYAAVQRVPTPTPGQPPLQTREQDATIYKSVDQGSTWTPVGGKGLPSEPMGRVGVAVVPGTQGNAVFAIASQGVFRSEDGGATWTRTTTDSRVVGNGYFSRIIVDPRNGQNVYVAQTSMYRSTNGGRTFDAWAGAPSGDDFHVIWINPRDNQNMILGVDQGAIVSVNGGKTWSSWYNQATGQFYHVITDNSFPYYVYGAQQDSGTAAVASRSDYGEITYREWAPTGGFEFSYIAPDPLHPNWVYIGGWYGSVLRFDKTTGQIVHVFVRSPKYRTANLAPVIFSPQDPHILYVGAQYVMKTTDGGFNWKEISPDLTQKPEAKPAEGAANPPAGGPPATIITLAVSTVKEGEIWAGTSNGLIQVTKDSTTWLNVTPANLQPRSAVRALEASRHDPAKAYAVIARQQDLHPYIYRTRDFGQNWKSITSGLPDSAAAFIVREDPVRAGLLYAGTGNAVYVSFDDGDHWQTLQLNLPTATVTDLTVHGDDLAASTYGRAMWILDDVTPLRQIEADSAKENVHLFRPQASVRWRWDMTQDTPLPIETPAGKNPPDGAIIDYYLKTAPSTDLKLTIYDSQNKIVREYSSVVPPQDNTLANVPSYWFAPPAVLSKTAGLNRFVWDLRYPEPRTMPYSYYGNLLDYVEYTLADHAIPGETPRVQPPGPLAVPGKYSVALTVGGKTYRQELTVVLDPRVHVPPADLVQQLDTEKSISAQMAATSDGYYQVAALRAAIADRQKALAGKPEAKEAADAAKALDDKAALVQNGNRTELGLGPLNRELARLAVMIESGDARPAAPLEEGVNDYCQQLAKRLGQWREANQSIAAVNGLLQKYSVAPLPVAANIPAEPSCK